jgi:cytochrome P450
MTSSLIENDRPPIEPYAPGFEADPYPTYAWLREHQPVHKIAFSFTDYPAWLISRYDDVQVVLTDAERFGNDYTRFGDEAVRGSGLVFAADSSISTMMCVLDAPDHPRMRHAVGRAFTARRIESVRAVVEQVTNDALDEISRADECDLLQALGARVSLTSLCSLMGVPLEEGAELRKWYLGMLSVEESERESIKDSVASLERYFDDLIARKRSKPEDDLISDLIRASDSGVGLAEDEIKPMLFLILPSGFEGGINLVGNGVLALLDHPDQIELLRDRPELARAAVDEIVRYDCPSASTMYRYVRDDAVTLSGVELPKHSLLIPAIASANRDPRRFVDPDRFDILRDSSAHLGFGKGFRYCVGAALMRLEGSIAIPRLLAEYPELTLAVPRDEIRFQPEILVRGVRELPVRPGPRRR